MSKHCPSFLSLAYFRDGQFFEFYEVYVRYMLLRNKMLLSFNQSFFRLRILFRSAIIFRAYNHGTQALLLIL